MLQIEAVIPSISWFCKSLSIRVLETVSSMLGQCYIQVPTSHKGNKKKNLYLKNPNLETAHITSTHNLLVKTWQNIYQGGMEMQLLARWPHTHPQISMVEVKRNNFWWTASCLLYHIENINTNRKQGNMKFCSEVKMGQHIKGNLYQCSWSFLMWVGEIMTALELVMRSVA